MWLREEGFLVGPESRSVPARGVQVLLQATRMEGRLRAAPTKNHHD